MMNDRVNGIDGLRAIAMTMVIAQHCKLLPFGWTGVWLFFVISGYVITHGFLREETKLDGSISKLARYGAFMRRRALRIVPAYFAYLLIALLVQVAISGWPGGFPLIGLLTFTYNWQMILTPIIGNLSWQAVGHLWTLSVEQQFYLLFPLLFLWVSTNWRWRVMLALVLVGPLIRWIWDIGIVIPVFSGSQQDSASAIYAATFCHIDAFILGALLAKFERKLIQYKALPKTLFLCACFLAIIYGAIYVFVNHQLGAHGIGVLKNIYSGILYGQNRQLWVYSAVNLLAASILLLTISKAQGTLWLSNRWLAWIGQISFGGYLIHALLLWIFAISFSTQLGHLTPILRVGSFLLVWIITVLIAGLSYKYFEQPCAQRFKNWASPHRTES